jgi:hypothetical protein
MPAGDELAGADIEGAQHASILRGLVDDVGRVA